MYANTDMQSKEIREFCKFDAAGEELLKMAITKFGLCGRMTGFSRWEGRLQMWLTRQT